MRSITPLPMHTKSKITRSTMSANSQSWRTAKLHFYSTHGYSKGASPEVNSTTREALKVKEVRSAAGGSNGQSEAIGEILPLPHLSSATIVNHKGNNLLDSKAVRGSESDGSAVDGDDIRCRALNLEITAEAMVSIKLQQIYGWETGLPGTKNRVNGVASKTYPPGQTAEVGAND
ncbi:hypothetical protein BDP27DRAFT_1405271 [Rhodocollybia butyracea]|uniref:Uncharacterized protein n=1 Tax=Rhodocollybia butyracea TaxID=206335 RepID=A0A9P5PG22_9AGAR|nr:hypothetical protein BDP27DRAFT_1405271 [Rhodocollybia butyracea]